MTGKWEENCRESNNNGTLLIWRQCHNYGTTVPKIKNSLARMEYL